LPCLFRFPLGTGEVVKLKMGNNHLGRMTNDQIPINIVAQMF